MNVTFFISISFYTVDGVFPNIRNSSFLLCFIEVAGDNTGKGVIILYSSTNNNAPSAIQIRVPKNLFLRQKR